MLCRQLNGLYAFFDDFVESYVITDMTEAVYERIFGPSESRPRFYGVFGLPRNAIVERENRPTVLQFMADRGWIGENSMINPNDRSYRTVFRLSGKSRAFKGVALDYTEGRHLALNAFPRPERVSFLFQIAPLVQREREDAQDYVTNKREIKYDYVNPNFGPDRMSDDAIFTHFAAFLDTLPLEYLLDVVVHPGAPFDTKQAFAALRSFRARTR